MDIYPFSLLKVLSKDFDKNTFKALFCFFRVSCEKFNTVTS